MKILLFAMAIGLLLYSHQSKKSQSATWDMPAPHKTGIIPLDGFYQLNSPVSNGIMTIKEIEVLTYEDGKKYACTHAKYRDANGHTLYHDEIFPIHSGIFIFEDAIASGGYAISGVFVTEGKVVGTIRFAAEGKIVSTAFEANLGL